MAFSVLDVLFNTPESVNTIDRLNSIVRLVSTASIGINTIRAENPAIGICGIACLSFTFAIIR